MSAVSVYPRRHAVSTQEFLQMGNAGVFSPETRLELVGGEILDMALIGSTHAALVSKLCKFFNRAAGGVTVHPQNPLILEESSVLQPDVALLRPRPDEYFGAHPRASDALLVIEVADTSLHFDLTSKIPLYARAGIAEAWVVDISQRAIRVFRDASPGGYRTSFTVTGSDGVHAAALPELAVSPDGLFPA